MNCSDYSTAWVCRACGSLVSLGYDEIGIGREMRGYSEDEDDDDQRRHGDDDELAAGPGGEYCRVCRAQEEDARMQRRVEVKGGARLRLERIEESKGAEMDVVAVPFVFRLLVAELAAMGIRVTIGLD